MICEYGCEQDAKYQLKNGKWCCCKSQNSCLGIRKKFSKSHSGENHHYYGKKRSKQTRDKISESNMNRIISDETRAKHSCRLKLLWNSNNSPFRSKQYLEQLSKNTKDEWKNLEIRNKIINNLRITAKKDIKYWKLKYPLFSQIEEMRYNPDTPIEEKEIQVHCKNSSCSNSKEQGGWFTPTYIQLYERIRGIEKTENDGSYFYCSDKCKDECVLYGLRKDPFQEKFETLYTDSEYQTWKQVVLEHDNYECQKCGSKENLHCHHINPVKTHPHMSLDPENGIVLCQICHYKIGHKTGTECSTGNLANTNQMECKLGN